MFHLFLRSCVVTLTSALLFACATNRMSYDDYLYRFQGMTQEELKASWGEPSQTVDMGALDGLDINLIYQHSAEVSMMVSPAIYQPYYDGRTTQQRIVQPERWKQVTQTCTTTFILQNAVVMAAYHEGNGCIAPKETSQP